MGNKSTLLFDQKPHLLRNFTKRTPTAKHRNLGWSEGIWTSIARKDGSMQIGFGMSLDRDSGLGEGYAGVLSNQTQHILRTSGTLQNNGHNLGVGRLSYGLADSTEEVKFVLCDSNTVPISFDLKFQPTLPRHFEDRQLLRGAVSRKIVSETIRNHQAGHVIGDLSVDGVQHSLCSEDWFAFRGHYFGFRPDIGRVPPKVGEESITPNHSSTYLQLWCAMELLGPDGSHLAFHFYLIMTQEKCIHSTASVYQGDGIPRRSKRVWPDLHYDDSTRQPIGGSIKFEFEGQETITVEVDRVSDGPGFHLGVGLDIERDHRTPENERDNRSTPANLLEEWGSSVNAPHNQHELLVYQLSDTVIAATQGEAKGFGILQSIAYGVWPQFGLTNNRIYECFD